MTFPSRDRAEELLLEAASLNPGPWEGHSRAVADTAYRIADACAGIGAEAAYVAGLLHDIGRRAGVTAIRHLFDGYDYLMALGFDGAARVCLTHSFQIKDACTFFGERDCTAVQWAFLTEFIANAEYGDIDRLIQLCDALALPNGPVLMEKRLVDVAMRHGLPDFTLAKWRASMELKQYFDGKAGRDIYTLLPNIVENTFGEAWRCGSWPQR